MKLSKLFLLFLAFSSTAFAGFNGATVPGESQYCLANCAPYSSCDNVITTLGQTNYTMGTTIGVCVPNGGCQQATWYDWSWYNGPNGTPTNLTGISTDHTSTYTIPQVLMFDSGLYDEVGTASNGSSGLTFCLTVNPIAVLSTSTIPLF